MPIFASCAADDIAIYPTAQVPVAVVTFVGSHLPADEFQTGFVASAVAQATHCVPFQYGFDALAAAHVTQVEPFHAGVEALFTTHEVQAPSASV